MPLFVFSDRTGVRALFDVGRPSRRGRVGAMSDMDILFGSELGDTVCHSADAPASAGLRIPSSPACPPLDEQDTDIARVVLAQGAQERYAAVGERVVFLVAAEMAAERDGSTPHSIGVRT